MQGSTNIENRAKWLSIKCYKCDSQVSNGTNRPRKSPKDGKYRCFVCQQKRTRKIKTECMREWGKTEVGRACNRRAKKAHFERNPELKKARDFIKSVNKRIKLYGGDLSKFKRKNTRELAAAIMSLPKNCQDCETIEDLTIHHIIPMIKDLSVAFEPTNLTALCRSCNTKRNSEL
jgi:5-methylcytosine-specific restriction endonuclease McrA